MARRFLDTLASSAKLERVFVSEHLERDAYGIAQRYAEHPFSFVDVTSFALMRQQRIEHGFAFDVHFRIAGFSRIPVDTGVTR